VVTDLGTVTDGFYALDLKMDASGRGARRFQGVLQVFGN
jgi:hypothetical protein